MKLFSLIIILVSIQLSSFGQANDDCSNSESLCDGNSVNGSTAGATNEICANCGDGASASGITCFAFEKTVWYNFTTNATGGDVAINVTNVNCVGVGNNISGMVYSATTPCDASTYTQVANCEANSTVGFSLNALALAPNTTYYVQISSGNDCTFEIVPTGTGISSAPSSVNISSNAAGTICEQTPVTYTANRTNCANPTYFWTINGNVISSGTSNTFTTNALQNGDDVNASINCDCSLSSSSNTIKSSMYVNTLDAGTDEIIPLGTSIQLNATGSDNYTWTPASTLDNPNSANPVVNPVINTTYFVSTTTPGGCTFRDSVTISVVSEIGVPNTFTPNSDGVNDTWEIINVENFPKIGITIYDRWGQEVYKTIGYPRSKWWNGTRGGKKLPSSTYYYVISLSIDVVEEKLITGSVTIVY
jgi:gliding motility-associated-like protein